MEGNGTLIVLIPFVFFWVCVLFTFHLRSICVPFAFHTFHLRFKYVPSRSTHNLDILYISHVQPTVHATEGPFPGGTKRAGAAAEGRCAPPFGTSLPWSLCGLYCVGCTWLMYSLYLDCEWTYLEHIWNTFGT